MRHQACVSTLVVISTEDLEQLIERAVRKALTDAGAMGAREEWVPAKTCPLPRTTLAKLRKKNVVRSSRVGRETYVNASDVEKWLASQAERPELEASNVVALPEPADPFESARARARARRAG